jgi:hypothetical protein
MMALQRRKTPFDERLTRYTGARENIGFDA